MKLERCFTLAKMHCKTASSEEMIVGIRSRIFSLDFVEPRFNGVKFKDVCTNEEISLPWQIGQIKFNIREGLLKILFTTGDRVELLDVLTTIPTFKIDGSNILATLTVRISETELCITSEWLQEIQRDQFVERINRAFGFEGGIVFPCDGFGETASIWGAVFPRQAPITNGNQQM